MPEPTVLDYVKALLTPWKGPPPAIPPLPESAEPGLEGELPAGELPPYEVSAPPGGPAVEPVPLALAEAAPAAEPAVEQVQPHLPAIPPVTPGFPWRSLAALGWALLGQLSFGPAEGAQRSWQMGALFYALGIAWLVWAYFKGEWQPAALPPGEDRRDPLTARWLALGVGFAVLPMAYLAFGGGKFTSLNLMLWLWALLAFSVAFWLPRRTPLQTAGEPAPGASSRDAMFLSKHFDRWLLVAVTLLVLFFRLFQLDAVPSEMVSDQAEKLLDVADVLDGQYNIFFPRNTGREAFQFYITAAIADWFGAGVSFLSLKIGTVLAGLLTLPFLYGLGVELGNRRVGLLAVALMGIAYWPNVISRFGLRFPFYMLFAAPTLYFLLRGLRRNDRNDFLFAGLALGIGLHGYTPFRIMPFVILVAVALYLLHRHSAGKRTQTLVGLAALVIISFVLFLPLLRYWQENPDIFSFRAFSRVGSVEAPLPGPAWRIFLENLWRAMTMFAWDDGEIWVISVPHRPALDVISAALFYLGGALLTIRYLRRRHWADLFLLLSVPLLLLPSVLSLAFPAENPALNRASAASIPVFLIAAIALEGLLTAISARVKSPIGPRLALAAGILLITFSALQNYDLVFRQYRSSFDGGAHNTSEMGRVIRAFGDLTGTTDTAWVLAYSHWVDTRLVGMNAGVVRRDFAIWPDGIAATTADPRAKLFIVNLADTAGLETLVRLYPSGVLNEYPSPKGKNFYTFFVPPSP